AHHQPLAGPLARRHDQGLRARGHELRRPKPPRRSRSPLGLDRLSGQAEDGGSRAAGQEDADLRRSIHGDAFHGDAFYDDAFYDDAVQERERYELRSDRDEHGYEYEHEHEHE